MGYDWAKDLVHVSFRNGTALRAQKLATRTGNVVLLEDIFRVATQKTLEIINEKNPGLENKEQVASAVGVGAVVFHVPLQQQNKGRKLCLGRGSQL